MREKLKIGKKSGSKGEKRGREGIGLTLTHL